MNQYLDIASFCDVLCQCGVKEYSSWIDLLFL